MNYADTDQGSSGAVISDCGSYRYLLWRRWGSLHGSNRSWCTFLMLNPSTADANADDATIRKCIGFAKRWGYSGLRVVNLFSWRATNPNALAERYHAIVGPDTDARLVSEFAAAKHGGARKILVCAWGSTGNAATKKLTRARVRNVSKLLADSGVNAFCLGRSGDGSPRHPLMLAYDARLEPWHALEAL